MVALLGNWRIDSASATDAGGGGAASARAGVVPAGSSSAGRAASAPAVASSAGRAASAPAVASSGGRAASAPAVASSGGRAASAPAVASSAGRAASAPAVASSAGRQPAGATPAASSNVSRAVVGVPAGASSAARARGDVAAPAATSPSASTAGSAAVSAANRTPVAAPAGRARAQAGAARAALPDDDDAAGLLVPEVDRELLGAEELSASSSSSSSGKGAGPATGADEVEDERAAAPTRSNAKPNPSTPRSGTIDRSAASSPTKATLPPPRPANDAARRAIAGAPTEVDTAHGPESPELRAIREADLELFPPASGGLYSPWPSDWPFLTAFDPSKPVVHASGFAPRSRLEPAPRADGPRELRWLRSLAMPELGVRWDARVVRYLEYYRDDPRGRSLLAGWVKKSGRYGSAMRKTLRAQRIPDDLVWASLIESGFEPSVHSPAGAAGLWQLMPAGAKTYGLIVDRWIDERLDPERSTEAAARYLSDLHRRFGGWELALAAYNMGYAGLLGSIRKYNTNDYWELARHEAGLPWETTLYVPKIVAVAVAARNLSTFGVDALRIDPPIVAEDVFLRGGITLRAIAAAAGVPVADIETLNPQIRAGRTPPAQPSAPPVLWRIRVPVGKGQAVTQKLGQATTGVPQLQRYVTRQGDTLDDVARALHAQRAKLEELNDIRPDEALRPGTVLLGPPSLPEGALAEAPEVAARLAGVPDAASATDRPVVVVSPGHANVPGHKRVFYRVVVGDRLDEVASAFRATKNDLLRWNTLDSAARLHEGMVLQVYARENADLSRVKHARESEVRPLVVGSEDFLVYFEGLRGRKRMTIAVRDGDTWEKIGKRYGLTVGQLERINRRSRTEKLVPQETLVVYAGPPTPTPTPAAKGARPRPGPRTTDSSTYVPKVAPKAEDLPRAPDVSKRVAGR